MKQIIKKFNNLVKKTIFKVENKTNNNFSIGTFNKYLITLITSLFFYLFFLLIPILYDKTWIQTNIERKLLDEFRINLSTSADISYRILPAPHFLIKDSKILVNTIRKQNPIAEIKEFKVFLNQKYFFNKEKIDIVKLIIKDANFSLLTSELKLFKNFRSKKFSNKKIKIKNSNIFLKDNLGEIILIIKIDKATSFFDNKKLSNYISLDGNVFNVPFIFELNRQNATNGNESINFNSKLLKLNILNKSVEEKNKLITGENYISFLNSKINTKYNIKEKLITFKSIDSRINKSQVKYNGTMSTNPFDLDLKINLDNHKISKLFNFNSVLIELIQSGLLFNESISLNTSITVNSNIGNTIFQNAKINFHIVNGKINLNKTMFSNEDIGSLQLSNSNLFLKDKRLVFNSNLLIDIQNSKKLFSFLNTNKLSRKNFKKISINLDYDFLSNEIKFNNLKIDNKRVNDQLLDIIDNLNDNNLNNFNKSRRIINKLIEAYAG
jgi:hypothetical protein